MSAIDRVKGLLAAAKSHAECGTLCTRRCQEANEELEKNAILIAEELVASQEALLALFVEDMDVWRHNHEGMPCAKCDAIDAARAALRLDSLAKAMESR